MSDKQLQLIYDSCVVAKPSTYEIEHALRDVDPEIYYQKPPRIVKTQKPDYVTPFDVFRRTRFVRSLLAKRRVQSFNVVSSEGGVLITGMNGSTYHRQQVHLVEALYNELPKLVNTYLTTLFGNKRIKLDVKIVDNTMFFGDVEIKIKNLSKTGQVTKYSNEYSIEFHRISVKRCSNEEYKRIFDAVANAINMSGLKVASKYFDPVQDNQIIFDINEEEFPSIPMIDSSLSSEIEALDEQIADLTKRRNELAEAQTGLTKIKQLYRGKQL